MNVHYRAEVNYSWGGGGGGGGSGGAMILGKLPVQGRLTIWIKVGQGPTALVRMGVVCTFVLSSIIFLTLSLSGRRPYID